MLVRHCRREFVRPPNPSAQHLRCYAHLAGDIGEIQPRFDVPSRPRILDILRRLPQTNCRQCGLPTCLVFAAQVSEGLKGPGDCPPFEGPDRKKLTDYLADF